MQPQNVGLFKMRQLASLILTKHFTNGLMNWEKCGNNGDEREYRPEGS